jgi:hypothetical protein
MDGLPSILQSYVMSAALHVAIVVEVAGIARSRTGRSAERRKLTV